MIENREEILSSGNREPKEICLQVIAHALKSVNTSIEIRRRVGISSKKLRIFGKQIDLDKINDIYVIGGGKASYAMAEELENKLSDRIREGVIVTKYGYMKKPLSNIRVVEANHPVPDQNGLEAGEEILHIASKAEKDDLVINLISGGGSALLCSPQNPITLEEMQNTTDLLVRSGATINDINAVRKHISKIKGGKLAEKIHPASCISLIVSDVVGDPLDVIASGPTVPDPTTFEDAYRALENYSLPEKVPKSVLDNISKGMKKKIRETPKKGQFRDMKIDNIIISSNDKATEAAAEKSKELGFETLVLSRMIEGESKEVGIVTAGILRDVKRTQTPVGPPATLISGGETTVKLSDEGGEGGPNQEFVLGAASKISDLKDVAVAAIDTDGTDGPTDVAGGIVDGSTVKRLNENGLNLSEILRSHNSSPALKKLGDAIFTGPTGTNVNDLRIAVVL